jgi:hypothetical protein
MAAVKCSTISFDFCFVELVGRMMRSTTASLIAAIAPVVIACLFGGPVAAQAEDLVASGHVESLDAATLKEISGLYRGLIDAENRHDLSAVRAVTWESPWTLFVAKTATPEEGNWAGFWGTDIVMRHLAELYEAGPFRIDPDYDKEKTVGLTRDVAETYVPVSITVAYAGQTPVPKPFLMILNWIRTPQGWRMASDIALPIPPARPA